MSMYRAVVWVKGHAAVDVPGIAPRSTVRGWAKHWVPVIAGRYPQGAGVQIKTRPVPDDSAIVERTTHDGITYGRDAAGTVYRDRRGQGFGWWRDPGMARHLAWGSPPSAPRTVRKRRAVAAV